MKNKNNSRPQAFVVSLALIGVCWVVTRLLRSPRIDALQPTPKDVL